MNVKIRRNGNVEVNGHNVGSVHSHAGTGKVGAAHYWTYMIRLSSGKQIAMSGIFSHRRDAVERLMRTVPSRMKKETAK